MGCSSLSTTSESVDITSDVLAFEAKMEANASSLTTLGKVSVTEIGRWREKKLVRAMAMEHRLFSRYRRKAV